MEETVQGRTEEEQRGLRRAMKQLGGVFDPIIPGIITAGLCAGFASLLAQLVPDYGDSRVWSGIYQLLNLVNVSFMTYMTAWIGYSAAGRFGATPILGGMLGQLPLKDAVRAGVCIHADAGDRCAAELGEYAMTPSDMIAAIPAVTKTMTGR